eukprot:870337-Rhodomonas_salina.3
MSAAKTSHSTREEEDHDDDATLPSSWSLSFVRIAIPLPLSLPLSPPSQWLPAPHTALRPRSGLLRATVTRSRIATHLRTGRERSDGRPWRSRVLPPSLRITACERRVVVTGRVLDPTALSEAAWDVCGRCVQGAWKREIPLLELSKV